MTGATLVVVPTFEEAGNIVGLLEQVRRALPDADVVVVDDASPDGTANLAEATGARLGRVTVILRPAKGGLGAAYRDTFVWALAQGYDVVATMDADLSHDPRVLPALVRAVEDGADLAIGSRYIQGGSTPGWNLRRRALSRLGNGVSNLLLGLDLSDATSGFRAYRASRLRAIDVRALRADGYGAQVELAYRVARSGGRVVELPISFRDRCWGRSKLTPVIVLEALWLVARLRMGRLRTPIHNISYAEPGMLHTVLSTAVGPGSPGLAGSCSPPHDG